jgi:hypothetical protein
MSVLHSPRTPWVMLTVFSVAALLFFGAAAGRDFGLTRDIETSPELATVKREIRMPIIMEEHEAPRTEKKMPRAMATAPPPTPAGQPVGLMTEATVEAAPPPHPVAQKRLPAIAGTLLSHDFRPDETKLEAVFQTDKSAAGAKIFFKASPAMWVLDLPGSWKNAARRVNPIDRGPIDRVVIGEHGAYLRVVFQYRDRGRPRPPEPPLVTEKESGFTVIIPFIEP